jgi:proteasome assembly chaperone (PAC2) family protein
MATLTKQLDDAIEKLQDIHGVAIDEELETQAERLEELIDPLREIDFSEPNEEFEEEQAD